jgi:hypothetical protein
VNVEQWFIAGLLYFVVGIMIGAYVGWERGEERARAIIKDVMKP